MAEPPILPNAHWPNEATTNPFAPTTAGTERNRTQARSELNAAFFACCAVLFAAFVVGIASGVPFSWALVVTLVPAAIRVPLLQRRLSRLDPFRRLPSPVALLFTSWAWVAAFAFASCVTFVVICIPATMLTSNPNGSVESVVWGVSVLAGCLCFCALFVASLRLPV